MIRLRSLQHQYDEFWSGDEAFVQPPDEPTVTREADPKAWEAWEADVKEHFRKVRVARETGKWDLLRIEGSSDPTRFVLRPVPGNLFRRIIDRYQSGAIGTTEMLTLLFQLALVDVANLPGVKEVKRFKHGEWGDMANLDVPNLLDKYNPAIVGEIGSAIRERSQGVLPLL